MKLLFLGDFLYDYDYLREDIINISKYIKDNNLITILNLESPLKSGKKLKKPINLCSNDIVIKVLKMLNVKAVNLANNHIMDFCEEGLKLTIQALDKAGIGHFGAGENLNDAIKPYIIKDKKSKISLYGFAWNMEEAINAKKNRAGTAPLNFKLINSILNKDESHYIIPTFHFGYEYEKLPQPYHLLECRKIANNKKIKMIIGHHPHVVQAYDKDYNIFYSLGNFYFGTMRQKYDSNHKYHDEANKGIGIILDTNTWSKKIISIITENETTKIQETADINNFKDISNISISEYQKYFYQNNNLINKKYVYKTNKLNLILFNKTNYLRRNIKKFYLRNIKWPLGRKIKGLLERKKIWKKKNYY